jgi:hypothetical protein
MFYPIFILLKSFITPEKSSTAKMLLQGLAKMFDSAGQYGYYPSFVDFTLSE